MELLTSSVLPTENVSLKPTFCSNCAFCKMLKRARRQPISNSISSRGINKERRFWTHVDMFANNIYWASSQAFGETSFPIIQKLHKTAITQHPFMSGFSKKFKLKDFDTDMDMVDMDEYVKILNSIQAEEMRFAKALMCVGSHYSKLAFHSKAHPILEALKLIDNISKCLCILWQTELGCWKAVWEDDLSRDCNEWGIILAVPSHHLF